MRKTIVSFILAGAGALAGAGVARGDPIPQVTQLACDTLSVDPLRIRISFGVLNLDLQDGVCAFTLSPEPGSHVISCGTPLPGWTGSVIGLAANWSSINPNAPDCIEPGDSRAPFEIVTDGALSCYGTVFHGPVADFGYQVVCFSCAPVPARPFTWGKVKSVYR